MDNRTPSKPLNQVQNYLLNKNRRRQKTNRFTSPRLDLRSQDQQQPSLYHYPHSPPHLCLLSFSSLCLPLSQTHSLPHYSVFTHKTTLTVAPFRNLTTRICDSLLYKKLFRFFGEN